MKGNNSDRICRPPRLARIFAESPVYFVTFCTHNRQALLANEGVHNIFQAGSFQAVRNNAAVGCYVIMPDHIHIFIRIGRGGKLSVTVKFLREGITKYLRRNNPDLRVWQPGFFDHVLRSGESYAEKWEYVRYNPVRAGLVKKPEEWLFQGEIETIVW
ncbi:MAG: hypothetical protein A2283_13585 [Lentisphaerae bacterium RIFOXYA12_FULL_48_11]|nr:MAG: hypothetical protein A2283_13585 [Lentisphaerae bacterium RIFOXYA12_FULL_48_11]